MPVLENKESEIKRAFLRGYLDTDGSITFDKKIQNTNQFKKKYNYYPQILFSSVSKQLMLDVQKLCPEEGFKCNVLIQKSKNPQEKTKFRIQILGVKGITTWMKNIGTNNPTKRSRYEIWLKYGFGPPNTTYEQRKKVLKGELNPYKL